MEITIKRPDFQGAINGVIFDNEDILNAAVNILNVVNDEFGELYNNGFIDCLHDLLESAFEQQPSKLKDVEQALIANLKNPNAMTLGDVHFHIDSLYAHEVEELNRSVHDRYGLRPYYNLAAINTKDGFTAIDKRLNHEDVFKRLVSLVAEYENWALEDLADMLGIDSDEEDAIVKALLEKTLTGVYDFTLETDNAALRLYDPINNDGRLINFWARGDLHIFARGTI